EFHRRVMSEARAGRVEGAVVAVRERLYQAESNGNEDDALLLYSILLDVYSLAQDDGKARECRAEREAKYPHSLDVKMSEGRRRWCGRGPGGHGGGGGPLPETRTTGGRGPRPGRSVRGWASEPAAARTSRA